MSDLLHQFIEEARDFLQTIGEKLMALETQPDDPELLTELFRAVHTLKGNSGLFEIPEMTRVLHAGEDLMDAVRDGRLAYDPDLADQLLDAMDFVSLLLDELEAEGRIDARHAQPSATFVQNLRAWLPSDAADASEGAATAAPAPGVPAPPAPLPGWPAEALHAAWAAAQRGEPLWRVLYHPEPECFFKGEDPFHHIRQTPGLLAGAVRPADPWAELPALDCYHCILQFDALAAAPREALDEHFRFVPEQVGCFALHPLQLVLPQGHPNGGPIYEDFVQEALALLAAGQQDELRGAAEAMRELSSPDLWIHDALGWLIALLDAPAVGSPAALQRLIESLRTLSAPDWSDLVDTGSTAVATPQTTAAAPVAPPAPVSAPAPVSVPVPAVTAVPEAPLTGASPPANRTTSGVSPVMQALWQAQADALDTAGDPASLAGRLQAVAVVLQRVAAACGQGTPGLDAALQSARTGGDPTPLRAWMDAHPLTGQPAVPAVPAPTMPRVEPATPAAAAPAARPAPPPALPVEAPEVAPLPADGGEGRGRREDTTLGRVLKVEQGKIDRLMDLIGEMVVAKNSLPYLANRAENQYGVRDLAREIKAQYGVINRIAEEMQDAIMQVRMMPVATVFQRFPRLVRDLCRKLGKEVELVLEGEETEADKNIVEALADPLIHIVRNSLDHGFELPAERSAAGKRGAGRLLIRAAQAADRVVIEIADDGRGIDPARVKRKAYEKGLIDEDRLERLSDQEAIELVFAPGFSTAEAISDLSGRGVGMDVVRTAIERVGGTVGLSSTLGQGTTLTLSLPLSMAVTNVMIIESDGQIFGVPMDMVSETVRLPAADIHTFKDRRTTTLRGRLVPLLALNDLLGIARAPVPNDHGELATLVVRVAGQPVGLLVDGFREVVDVILKPLPGELGHIRCYAGSALLGDGSVLIVLNPKELV